MKRSSGISRRAVDGARTGCAPRSRPSPRTSSRWILPLRARSVKMSAGSLTQPSLVEQLDLLLAQALDVEGAARDEMLEMLDGLVRADRDRRCSGATRLLAGRGHLAHHVGVPQAGTLVSGN